MEGDNESKTTTTTTATAATEASRRSTPGRGVEHPQHRDEAVRDPLRAADVAALGSDGVDAKPDPSRALADARTLFSFFFFLRYSLVMVRGVHTHARARRNGEKGGAGRDKRRVRSVSIPSFAMHACGGCSRGLR